MVQNWLGVADEIVAINIVLRARGDSPGGYNWLTTPIDKSLFYLLVKWLLYEKALFVHGPDQIVSQITT
jgi:hypothetical protein